MTSRSTAELVLAEVLNNVAEHAYGDGQGPVAHHARARLAAGFQCLIVDQGAAMPGGSFQQAGCRTAPARRLTTCRKAASAGI